MEQYDAPVSWVWEQSFCNDAISACGRSRGGTIGRKCAIQEELLWDHRILLVEDHDLNAKIVTRLLESKQIQVERAKNGKEAVELYAASAPYSYDAILMDIQMPVMDGIEASKKIRMLERPDARLIPIIALTANVFDVDVQRSKAVEMNAHLVKPIDPQKLFRTLIALWK